VAAQLLAGHGFKHIYNLAGGIKAWQGEVAEGPVELNLDMVRGDEMPEEIIRLAYGMELSLGTFYRTAQATAGDTDVVALLDKLASVEDAHKQYLLQLQATMTGREISPKAMDGEVSQKALEGGFGTEDLLKNNQKFLHSIPDLLDLSMMVETQALDLYVRFANKTDSQETKRVLYRIADEEKGHLAALGRLRQEKSSE